MQIGYLGPRGTFSHKAAGLCFPAGELREFRTITQAVLALEKKQIDRTVIPIENSIQGGVTETLDCLTETNKIFIIREIVLEIKQSLLANKNYALQEIKKICSHPQALAQCQEFIRKNIPMAQIINTASTAFAAHEVSQQDFCACIASIDCAREYNLVVLSNEIQDNNFNKTRFWVLSRQENLDLDLDNNNKVNKINKMSVIIWLENKTGALYGVLEIFIKYNINLLRIESRPAKTQLGTYVFLLDFEINNLDLDLIYKLLDSLRNKCQKIKILGRYHKED